MMEEKLVVIISSEIVPNLIGEEWKNGILYNPIQLSDGRWFVSVEEADTLLESEKVELIHYSAIENLIENTET